LPELRDILRERLRERGRLDWAEEEFRLLTRVRWAPAAEEEPAYLRMKGAKALKPRELAVLRELFQWREDLAQRTDRAAFRILNNEPMFAMAKSPPPDLTALKQVRGVGVDQAERRGRDILAAVQRGLTIPEHQLPRIERPARRPHDAAYEARLERLKAARNVLALRYDLAPGVLCSNGVLEAVARINPSTPEQMGGIPELRRWQFREIGNDLLAAVRKPAA
jgi:ribonuclease D